MYLLFNGVILRCRVANLTLKYNIIFLVLALMYFIINLRGCDISRIGKMIYPILHFYWCYELENVNNLDAPFRTTAPNWVPLFFCVRFCQDKVYITENLKKESYIYPKKINPINDEKISMKFTGSL